LHSRSRERAPRIDGARDARFGALVQHAGDVLPIVEPEGTIRSVSPSMATVFGHDAA